MTRQRLSLGHWGEQQAVAYLKRRFYRIVATNYRTPVGEIDIIARKGGILAFVEVKTRSTTRAGSGGDAVNLRKQRQIIRVAQWYLNSASHDNLQPRFDVIAIQVSNGTHSIEHIVDAFCL